MVVPTIDSPQCQDQLTDAAKTVDNSVEQLCKDAELACNDERYVNEQIQLILIVYFNWYSCWMSFHQNMYSRSVGDLRKAARRASNALNDLLSHIRAGPRRARVTQEVHNICRITY